MTTNSKNKINWYYILLGLLFIAGYCYPNTIIEEADLNTKTITLYRDIELLKGGARDRPYHRFWTNETKAAFIIKVPGSIAAKPELLSSLMKGDTLTIKYFSADETEVNNKSKEIPIYFLKKGDHLYFDAASYNRANTIIDNRWNWLLLIGGILLTLRGTTIINSKTTYILAGISLVIIVVLRIINKF